MKYSEVLETEWNVAQQLSAKRQIFKYSIFRYSNFGLRPWSVTDVGRYRTHTSTAQPAEDNEDSKAQTHLEGNDQVDGFSHSLDVFGSQMARETDFRML